MFFREDSVWAIWFKEVILNGSVHNYWIVKPRQSNSWLVNKLIKLSSEVFPLIKMRLENGRSDRFWSDNWAPLGLVSALRDSPNSRLGIPLNAAIASLFRDDHWNLPAVRSEEMLQVCAFLTTIQLTENHD